jgi:hypothetical protein
MILRQQTAVINAQQRNNELLEYYEHKIVLITQISWPLPSKICTVGILIALSPLLNCTLDRQSPAFMKFNLNLSNKFSRTRVQQLLVRNNIREPKKFTLTSQISA